MAELAPPSRLFLEFMNVFYCGSTVISSGAKELMERLIFAHVCVKLGIGLYSYIKSLGTDSRRGGLPEGSLGFALIKTYSCLLRAFWINLFFFSRSVFVFNSWF